MEIRPCAPVASSRGGDAGTAGAGLAARGVAASGERRAGTGSTPGRQSGWASLERPVQATRRPTRCRGACSGLPDSPRSRSFPPATPQERALPCSPTSQVAPPHPIFRPFITGFGFLHPLHGVESRSTLIRPGPDGNAFLATNQRGGGDGASGDDRQDAAWVARSREVHSIDREIDGSVAQHGSQGAAVRRPDVRTSLVRSSATSSWRSSGNWRPARRGSGVTA